ncbi:glucose dehydrogenase [FAD, quinone]-like [Hermetia illucens]|nr:glucose dehydrogenase [FAD, quinone]-like [Hermetia illucens]
MESIGQTCAARSLGPANYLVTTLISSLVSMHCNTSPLDMWPPDQGEEAVKNGFEKYDFIVVGAGSAGSVVASRLAENPDHRVLLLEAGSNPPMESEIPGLAFTLLGTKYDWKYETTTNSLSCLGSEGESCTWHKGKTLGGSSAIDYMNYHRGNSKDYDLWEDEGNPSWSWRDILSFFKKSQNFKGDNSYDVHGTGGPITVEPCISSKHDQYMLLEASAELGYSQVTDFVPGQNLGFGFLPCTMDNGRRVSTARAYLLEERPNLHIVRDAYVHKIEFDAEMKATSVKLKINSTHELEADATKEIILSAGAIETPKLLMLSGIGPQTQLRLMGIPVLKDLPVGENLQDHCSVSLFLKYQPVQYLSKEKQLLDEVYNQWIHHNGAYGNAALDIAGFISTKRSTRYPDVQYQFIPMANSSQASIGFKSNIQASFERIPDSYRILKIDVGLLRPRSRGHVRLESKDITKPPIIIPNTFQKDSDLKTIVRGIKEIADFERTKSFERVHARIIRINLPACDLFRYKSTKYWECYAKYMTSSMYHAAGTARMGPDRDIHAVVDPELRVKGTKGLRVADASIFPNIVSGNLNPPTIMVGEKAAEFIKDAWRQP